MAFLASGPNECSAPVIGMCRSDETSSRVIVISPTGRWKLLVSLSHLSTKADMSLGSVVITEHLINESNPVAAIIPLISAAGLQNLSTFLPWETNLRSGHS